MKSKKVLLVDDEEGLKGMIKAFTEGACLGLEIATAGSAKEAVIISAQNKYDWGLVVLDGLGGGCFRVAEIIRYMNPETEIMLWSSDGDLNKRLPHPDFNGTLDKPLRIDSYTSFLKELYSNGSQDK